MYSGIRRNAYRGLLSQVDADNAYNLVSRLPVTISLSSNLYDEAWSLAKRFNRPTIYDCCYLALASVTGSDFWTADMRLVNSVGSALPFVHAL
jgi:predicted nucleic acid-binding protein